MMYDPADPIIGYENSIHCFTFKDKRLLRGVDGHRVLSGFGSIFNDSAGTAETYGLSRRVTGLDAFISHNWAMPRLPKVLSLLFYYNAALATAVGLLGAFVGFALTVCGVLPVYVVQLDYEYEKGPWCTLFFIVSLGVTYVFGHKLGDCLGLPGRVVFLDKVCIHQTDKELQRQGIASLGAFLNCSKRMVIVYSDLYLQRLWTVYELASFLALKPSADMVVLLPEFAVLYIVLIICCNFGIVFNFLAHTEDALEFVSDQGLTSNFASRSLISLAWLYVLVPILILMRRWARTLSSIRTTMEEFNVREAACFQEDDRALIYANISGFMKDMDLVQDDASEDMALDAFDDMVRSTVPRAVMGTLQRVVGASYRIAVSLSMCWLICGLDRCAGAIVGGEPRRRIVLVFIYFCTLTFSLSPLMFSVMFRLVSKWPDLRGRLELAYIFVCAVGIWLAEQIICSALLVSRDMAMFHNLYMFECILFHVGLAIMTFVVFWVIPQKNSTEHLAGFPCAECSLGAGRHRVRYLDDSGGSEELSDSTDASSGSVNNSCI
eukprot:TRINITY_DN15669_c0_g1_i2.p1 TRINITY_DN15669_c0_g1~~TRINITY_DN15669_c0_g1_i2.p1  ORF type:complete len:587 (+),score=94.80 TRINITY_DN15669_c0_g1_i2:117-1763(+)